MRFVLLAAAAALVSCSPPSPQAPAPPAEPPAVAACNDVAPNMDRLVAVQDEAAVSLPASDLRGGRIAPGTYDLARAVRIGEATGWSGSRAVALGIAETDAGVVLNWAGAAPGGAVDSWTATLAETPQVHITYTCGRVGEVNASFMATPEALDLQIADGASGSLYMTFERRQ